MDLTLTKAALFVGPASLWLYMYILRPYVALDRFLFLIFTLQESCSQWSDLIQWTLHGSQGELRLLISKQHFHRFGISTINFTTKITKLLVPKIKVGLNFVFQFFLLFEGYNVVMSGILKMSILLRGF